MTLREETRTAIERARDRYPRARSAILPALWAVQHEQGQISPDAMTEVAGILQVTPSEVEAVSTFYRSEERRVGKECRSRWSPYH